MFDWFTPKTDPPRFPPTRTLRELVEIHRVKIELVKVEIERLKLEIRLEELKGREQTDVYFSGWKIPPPTCSAGSTFTEDDGA